MTQWITSFTAWFQIIITLLIIIGGFVAYRHPRFHTRRTLLALIALVFLALTQAFVVLAQAYVLLPTRSLSPTLLTTLFGCCMSIYLSEFQFRRLQGRGWNITRICLALFYVVLTLFVGIGYIYNLQ